MAAPIIAFFNKQPVPLDELRVPVTDRAYLFGDAVYEVLRVYNGRAFLFEKHMARLARSLREVLITNANVTHIAEDILSNIAVNHVREGMVYVQVSRGCAPRNHSFFNEPLTPSILIYTKPFNEHPALTEAQKGMSAITHDDIRWGRCDIKTINLLANCLAQSEAFRRGCKEAILCRHDLVTEGSSCNVFLARNDTVITPSLDNILPGTRRDFLINAFRAEGVSVEERPVNKAELFIADEIFVSSTIKEVIAVTNLDGHAVGQGGVGPMVKRAQGFFADAIAAV